MSDGKDVASMMVEQFNRGYMQGKEDGYNDGFTEGYTEALRKVKRFLEKGENTYGGKTDKKGISGGMPENRTGSAAGMLKE